MIVLPPAPNLCNNVDKNKILDENVRIIRNKLLFLLILSDVLNPANHSQT